MAKINGNEIRPGNIIEHDGGLWVAVKTAHVKPGKGGAFAQVELKNLRTGSKLNERFRSADKVEKVRLDQKDQQFLYETDGMLVFMDSETYEQIELPADLLGDRRPFLQDGMTVTIEYYEEEALSMTLPDRVTCKIVETEPVVKGQTAANSSRSWCPPLSARTPTSWSRPRHSNTSKGLDIVATASPTLNIMIKAARKAGRKLVRDFGEVENLQVSIKGPGDFVSAADRKAEQIIR
jgi:elongation factor P